MAKLVGNVVIIVAGGIILIAGVLATAIVLAYVSAVVIVRRLLGRSRPALTAGG